MDIPFILCLAKIIGGITGIIILTSIIFLFYRKYRKTGIRVLSILFAGFIFTVSYIYFPRHFEKHYLKTYAGTGQVFFRHYADSLGFYIGTVGTYTTIPDTRFHQNFNSITPENALKIGSLLVNNTPGNYDFSHADSIVDLALEKKLRVRGHTLVWGKASWMYKAPDLEKYLDNFPEDTRDTVLWNLIKNYVTTVLEHYKGKIYIWDAVNEPLATWGNGELEENVYIRYLGDDYIEKILLLAHAVDPDVKLYINEIFWHYKSRRAEAFYRLLKNLKEKNIPVHGVGIQCHITSTKAPLNDLEEYIRKITDLGLEVEITELDARLVMFRRADDPYRAQAEYYAEILKICLNNPMCKGLTFWGFWDKECWYNHDPLFPKPYEPYLFDENMNPKPAFFEISKMLQHKYEKRKTKNMSEN